MVKSSQIGSNHIKSTQISHPYVAIWRDGQPLMFISEWIFLGTSNDGTPYSQ
jgi:hypothetical protein